MLEITCHTGTTKRADCVGADGIWSAIIGEVSISALIDILTPHIRFMVSIPWPVISGYMSHKHYVSVFPLTCVAGAGPAAHCVGAVGLSVSAVVPGVGGVG